MHRAIIILALLAVGAEGCEARQKGVVSAGTMTPARATRATSVEHGEVAAGSKTLFLDVHDVGPGKVTAQAVAQAHQKDLASEGPFGVEFKAYWLDEQQGKIYCLAEAPSADALNAVHRVAHGLLANEIHRVVADNSQWLPTPGMKLYLDSHHLGAGKVDAQAAAQAHQKDLAAQAQHHVRYLNYWLDADSGTIRCLSEAPNAEAALAVHREAHGLMPDSIEEVAEGR